ncbi:MAG: A/G-specific adenine glycosylase [Bacteroidota bacterium]
MNNLIDEIYVWYNNNKRELPWRNTTDPYKIWISEIILQQTRVAQGTEYYLHFVEKFPTVQKLAQASENEVLKVWQGLGYYSRARNLHTAAKYILNQFNGKFPDNYEDILKLKGIGEYTAAAITSIAFNLPYPTVDGNIYRFLSRYFGIETPIDTGKGKKEFRELSGELISESDPGFHNQALMEFGALQCIPKSPDCKNCLVMHTCFAAKNNAAEKFPVKTKKGKQTKRYFYYYLINSNDSVYLEKRTKNDIWRNLYQLPMIESKQNFSDKELLDAELPFINDGHLNLKSVSKQKKHILSHQVIFAKVIIAEINEDVKTSDSLIRVNKKDIYKFAVPKLVEQFLEELLT